MEYFFINRRMVYTRRVPLCVALNMMLEYQTNVDCKYNESSFHETDGSKGTLPCFRFKAILKMRSLDSDDHQFNERLKTMGGLKMKNGFMNKHHQLYFEKVTEKLDKNNQVMMSAVYLLTADFHLWNQVKRHVEKNRICFGAFKPKNCTETGYTVYCAAKDVYLGTKHFTLSDLADKNLISPRMFEVICTAMAIRRYGVEILDQAKGGIV